MLQGLASEECEAIQSSELERKNSAVVRIMFAVEVPRSVRLRRGYGVE